MIKIRVIFPGLKNPDNEFRKLADLLPFQDQGVELSLGYNTIGCMHCQTTIENAMAVPGMAQQAMIAEQEGMDAIVIDSMGDTGLFECREAVKIPVIGMSDIAFRMAAMLGRKFGVVTAGSFHGYVFERLMKLYGVEAQCVGCQPMDMQPFFTDAESDQQLHLNMADAVVKLNNLGADIVVLGGSYFLGKTEPLSKILAEQGHKQIVLVDPLSLAIRAARMFVDAKLSHSKIIYANPTHDTPVIGYPSIPKLPGLIM
jgi:allantoin racemase